MAVTTTPSASTSTPAPARPVATGAGQTSFRRETPAASVVNPAPREAAPAADPAAQPPAVAAPTDGSTEATPAAADGTTPATTTDNPENDPKFAAKFAALTKREREIVTREQTLKAREAQLADYEKARASGKLNPLELLKEHGWSYDQLTQLVLNDGKLTSDQELRIIKEQQAKDSEAAEADAKKAQAERIEKAVLDHKTKLKEHIDSNGEKFRHIRAQPENYGYELVYSVQEEHYEKTAKENGGKGEILSFDAAADKVESYLHDQFKALQTKFTPQTTTPAESEPASGNGGSPAKTAPSTLTNAVHATAASAPQTKGKILSPEESKREAAKLLRWT